MMQLLFLLTPTEQSVIMQIAVVVACRLMCKRDWIMRKQSMEKKKIIFEAAIALIADGGLAGISMSKLAGKSGIPQATIYVYFASKEQLLREVYEYTEQCICRYIVDGFDMTRPVRECFREYFQRMIRLGQEHSDMVLVHEQFLASMQSQKLDLEQVYVYYEPLYEFIYRGQREGLIKPVAPIVILSYFSMPLNGLLFGDIIWGNHPQPDWYEAFFQMSWDAVSMGDKAADFWRGGPVPEDG